MSIRAGIGIAILLLGLFSGVRPWQVGSAVILGILVLILVFPQSTGARLLFSRHGPSLDAGKMTRQECWRSAGGFLVIGAGAIATIYGIALLEPWFGKDPWDIPVLAALLFMYAIFLLMGVLGAAYLAMRAPFRPRDVPTESLSDGGA